MMSVCRNIADKINAGRLSAGAVDDLMRRLETEKGYLQGLDDVEGRLMDKGRMIADGITAASLIERREALRRVILESRHTAGMATADVAADLPVLWLRAIMGGVNTDFAGAQRSVDAVGGAIYNSWAGGLIADLDAAGLLQKFNRMAGKLEEDVTVALADVNSMVQKGVKVSADALGIARIMAKYQRASVLRQNRAGGYVGLKDGRVVRQKHDPLRLGKHGREQWKADIRDHIDFRKMEVAPEHIEEWLDETFYGLESGVRLIDDLSAVERALKGPGNLARKISQHRVIEFNTPQEWLVYHRKYGGGSLREVFFEELDRAAKATALMDQFGARPKAMLERLKQIGLEKYRNDPEKRKGFQGGLESLDALMAEIDGSVNYGANTKAARLFAGWRAIQTMSKLGGTVITSLSDTVAHAGNRIYQGAGFGTALSDAVLTPLAGLGHEQRMFGAKLAGAGLESMLGHMNSRFNPTDNFTGAAAKTMQWYFKFNLLGPWTDMQKSGSTAILAMDLATGAKSPFEALQPEKQRLLRLYGIEAKEWEIARQAVRKGPNGNDYIFPTDVDDVSGAVFSGMTMAQQTRAKDHVKESLLTLFSNEADVSTPTAGARENAILRHGHEAGSAVGIALRMMVQFKSFPVAFNTKILGRHIYGQGSKTIMEQLGKGVGANLGLATLVAGTGLIGYCIMDLKAIVAGKEPREFSRAKLMAAMAQGGGLGIYGDFLFGEATRYGTSPLQTLAGPGIGSASELFGLLTKTKSYLMGDNPDLRAEALRWLKSNTPFANLFYLKGAMDYLIWYQLQEMVNPGYLGRMERRTERSTGQKFYVKPSQIVKYGGGFQ